MAKRTNSVKPLERSVEDRETTARKRSNKQADNDGAKRNDDSKASNATKKETKGTSDEGPDEELSFAAGNRWMEMLSSDGAHLREHRL